MLEPTYYVAPIKYIVLQKAKSDQFLISIQSNRVNGLVVKFTVAIGEPPVRFRVNAYYFAVGDGNAFFFFFSFSPSYLLGGRHIGEELLVGRALTRPLPFVANRNFMNGFRSYFSRLLILNGNQETMLS